MDKDKKIVIGLTILSIGLAGTLLYLIATKEIRIRDEDPIITEIQPTGIPTVIPTKSPTLIPSTKNISIQGMAYEDRNNNGIFDSNDIKLANMMFYIFDTYNGAQLSTVFTNSNGDFQLTIEVRGGVKIKPVSYNNFTPKTGEKIVKNDSNKLEFGFRSGSAPVEGSNVGIIEGDIFQDSNRNNQKDGGENGVYFYKLYLIGANGNYYNTVDDAQTTDTGGHFKYINLPINQTYTITLSDSSGEYEVTKPATTVKLTNEQTSKVGIAIPVYRY